MLKAAQSGAHILTLDLEDAVATTRKEVARKVIILLIRAFRGQELTKGELEFLKAHAMPQGKADQLEQQFVPVGDRFQLKERFPDNQMILIRPNNLRTKWTAGDYSHVSAEVGVLSVQQIRSAAPEVEEGNLGIVDYTAATGGRSAVQQDQYPSMRYPLLR